MPHPWVLEWYHLGDVISIVHGFTRRRASLLRSLRQLSPTNFRRVVRSEADAQGGSPELARRVRTIARGTARGTRDWRGSAFDDLDIRFVTMENEKQGEALLTPDALYLPWAPLAVDRAIETKRKDLGISLGSLPREATDGDHMWMMAAMTATDYLAKCTPASLPSDDPRQAFRAIEGEAKRRTPAIRLRSGSTVPAVGITKNTDVGTFVVLPDSGMKRESTYLLGHRGSSLKRLTLVVGTEPNVKQEDPDKFFDPWPCGNLGCVFDSEC